MPQTWPQLATLLRDFISANFADEAVSVTVQLRNLPAVVLPMPLFATMPPAAPEMPPVITLTREMLAAVKILETRREQRERLQEEGQQ